MDAVWALVRMDGSPDLMQMITSSHQWREAKKWTKLLSELLQKGQSLPQPSLLASLVDKKFNPTASSALIFTWVLTASCILTWWSKGKNGIAQEGGEQRKSQRPLCNPLPFPVTHLALSILAAESRRMEKWQLHPVISGLCAFKTTLRGLSFTFLPKTEKGPREAELQWTGSQRFNPWRIQAHFFFGYILSLLF